MLAAERGSRDILVYRRCPRWVGHIALVFDDHVMQYDACLHNLAKINLIPVLNWSLCDPPLDLQDAKSSLNVFAGCFVYFSEQPFFSRYRWVDGLDKYCIFGIDAVRQIVA